MSATGIEPPVIVIDTVDDTDDIDVEIQTINTPDIINEASLHHIADIADKAVKIEPPTAATINKEATLKVPAPNTGEAKIVKFEARDSIDTVATASSVVTIEPISSGKSSTPNGSHTRHRHHSKEQDLQHLSEDNLILAETLIKDADGGRNFQYKTDPNYVRFYILYHKWYFRWTLYLFILVNLCLAFFERPTKAEWELPVYATMIIEGFCLTFFIARVIHSAYFSIPAVFWRDTKNIMVIGIITLTIIDMIAYIIWNNAAPDTHPVRWSRPFRALLIINFSDGRQIRRAFRNIRRTVPEIMNVLILFMLSVLLFALLALKLFGRRTSLKYPNGDAYFKNYFDSIWDLYVLVTTANFPDVMMPAYDESKWFAIFFIVYMIICLYVFMSIVLAAIYNNYRNNLKNEIKMAVFGKRRKLRQAFEILKVRRNREDIITRTVWNIIMQRVLPGKSIGQIELMMTILDADGSGYISKHDFLNLVNLLQVPLSEYRERQTFIEKTLPNIYNSNASKVIRLIIRHKFFRIFFDFMIFLNAWFIGFDIDKADWFFLSIFMVEIIAKQYAFGPKEFFKRFWNTFDFFVIFAAVIATAIESAKGDVGDELSTLDLLLVLRVMRLIKIFGSIKRFKVILMTIINIGPSILTYGGVIFVLYYMFAIVGMEIFHGLIKFNGYGPDTDPTHLYCGNPKLNDTTFYRNHYCNNNFNDILKSFVLLFELTVVNQWHVLSSGFVIVTNKAARLYFFIFHLMCVVIVLNIFVAFILEAFILEYSIQKTGRLESVVESKIKELGLGIMQSKKKSDLGKPEGDKIELVPSEEDVGRSTPPLGVPGVSVDDSDSDTDSIPDISQEKGLRFHLKKKSRKKVEVLLQQMFEGEINPDDEGLDEPELFKIRSVTLDSVT